MKTSITVIAAFFILGGCDAFSFAGDKGNTAANQAAGLVQVNQTGGKPTNEAAVDTADAGITRSRSLQPMGSTGGKDPQSGAGDVAIDRTLLIGSWTDNGDCSLAVQFLPDGTFRSYTGGGGEWGLNGDQLTLTGDSGTLVLRLRSPDGQTIYTTDSNGAPGRSTRC